MKTHKTPGMTRPVLNPLSWAIFAAVYSLVPLSAWALDPNALPSNGHITAGSGSISSSGNVLNVNQSSDRLSTTWDTFNIGSAAQVNFYQPGASSVALNRVLSSDASQIFGKLNANGQVFLINPSGVLFGAGSAVNVGGLVASTLNLSDANFMAGKNLFEGNAGSGTVINQGQIKAADGGYVALLGAQVRNEGTVVARLGSVMLGAGEKVTLDFNGDGLINMAVDNPALNASVINSGALQANGGRVMLSARASNSMLNEVVNNSGVIEATSLQQRNGTIILDGGDSGVVANSGSLDVSGRNPGQTGGNVTLTGQYVGLYDGARIDASGAAGGGQVLVGGDFQGTGPLHQADATYMDGNASIHADALNSGDGGKVILWSKDSTRFYGNISVTGAGQAGKGGLAETSGHALDAFGVVNLSAASGIGGTWLIDPFNINITSGASSGATSSNPFTSSGSASSNLSSATLNASLSEGANILVYTTSVGGTSGDINVLDNVKAVGNASLTLQAHRNIVMTNTSISNASGKTLNVSLLSNFNNSGNGSVQLSNASIRTNGGNLTISGAASPTGSFASTNVSNGFGVSLNNSQLLTSGGDILIRGATSSTLASGSTAGAVQIGGASLLDAGGGSIAIVANQASTSGTGDAFVLTGGSQIVTSGAGSIRIDSSNLGSGNGTRIFSTSNTIAATGSGNITLNGSATSGQGVLICSTAAGSTQNVRVGSGTLTVNGSSTSGRGVNLSASGNGVVNLQATAGGKLLVSGDSGGSYGTILNATGIGSSINLLSDGDISLSGNTSGGTTPALALVSSGSGSAATPGSRINIGSSAGNVTLSANSTVINNTSGSFRAIFFDASGAYGAINVSTQSGRLTLDGTSASGRGVDLAPSGSNASVNLSTTTGDLLLSGNSTNSFGGYGIFFNSTGASQGVNVSTTTGNITLRGDSVGTSDAIALGGSGIASTNSITSQSGKISLLGNFHSPNSGELDHGIAILSVTNIIQTHGNGNITLDGRAADQGNGIDFYGNGRALVSVDDGQLTLRGSSGYADGIGMATGINRIQATGSGSVALTGSSTYGNGISLYPSGNASSATLSTVSGDLTLTGTSGAAGKAGILIRAASAGPANGVSLLSGSGNLRLNGRTDGSNSGIAIVGNSNSAYTLMQTGGSGQLSLDGYSAGGYALSFDGGNNSLLAADGGVLVSTESPVGRFISHTTDVTTFAASGSGAVVFRQGGTISNRLTDPTTASASDAMQRTMNDGFWARPLQDNSRLTPLDGLRDRPGIDLASFDQTSVSNPFDNRVERPHDHEEP
ncbi:beta strand repeat-containing protein [Pseudomonas gingeri]|uniref:Filamentous hemagglutinin N-terminal domain-containing protein n=3 Tax=Pseudomonas gingeri TaxID=117681 RepID=A0A7Y7XXB7_9PSED|nr:filamentous hemagglutinin N-terminal domain-containing protein [Pseudomonas gingeri]NWC13834.1 filamentous hemagglutinin N-terminal domain-containing protein [Pseudomonas gingeri]